MKYVVDSNNVFPFMEHAVTWLNIETYAVELGVNSTT